MSAERTVVPPGIEIDEVIDWLVLAKSELDKDGSVSFVAERCVCGRDTDDCGQCSPIFDWDFPGNYDEGAEIKLRCECDTCGHEAELVFTLQQSI